MIWDIETFFGQNAFSTAVNILFSLWPIWVPLILVNLAFGEWLSYKRREFIRKQGSVLLEIRLPRDVHKTPQAMELVLNGIFAGEVGNIGHAFLDGRIRDWFSLEIASHGGQIKFYIWCWPKWKKTLEARIYAQYPEAEVFEVEDYTKKVHFEPEKSTIWGATMKLNKEDPYPIKTYVEYEMHKNDKEQEQMVDPVTPMLEYLGTLKPGEEAWIQIMIQAHRGEGFLDARVLKKGDWKDGIKKAIQDIVEKEAVIKPEKDKPASILALTESKKDVIKAIERNASKLAYDTMIRVLYVAPKELYDPGRIGGILGSFRQYGGMDLNGIRPDWMLTINYPWQDFRDIRKREMQRSLLDAYKRRSFFNVPYKHFNGKPFVLSTEELATIFHLPGAVATTPNLTRAPSKKAEAPSNLPV